MRTEGEIPGVVAACRKQQRMAKGEMKMQPRPRVLFLCTGNSARSQMAEGCLRHLAGDLFEAFSAGTEPKGMNPLAVEAMRELGVDIAGHRSKKVDEFIGQKLEWVVTVCDHAREHCPFLPATHSLHWSLEDPAAAQGTHTEKLAVFRKVRDQILGRIKHELIGENGTRERDELFSQ
jgi:arsenate reductase